MSPRRAVVDVLERLAFAAELLDDDRASSYGRAAWAVRHLDGDLVAKRQSGELAQVRGIGKSTLALIDSVLAGERPDVLVTMEEKLPAGLFEIRRIKGLGAKKVKALHRDLGISTLGELEYACRENRLLDLKGFGKKTQANVLAQIAELRKSDGLMRRDRASLLIEPYLSALCANPGVNRASAVGEYRRGLELVRELSVLIAGSDPDAAIAAAAVARPPETPITVHTSSLEQLGARSVWLTSSAEHLALLTARALDRGLRYDEHGLWKGNDPLACPDESALYRHLGLVPTEPERRDADVPLVEEGKARARLVTREDLRGALHNHTVASDGSATLEQMREAAAVRELEYLGISEHSVSAFYARGLEADALRAQAKTIAELNERGDSRCTVLSGVESDILADGALDYGSDVLGDLEVVVASVHRRHSQDSAQMTARLIGAAKNPWTMVIGHPTGRLLLGRPPSELDMEAFLDACAESGCAVEHNANPHRLDLSGHHLAMAKERKVLVSIAADAHSVDELDNLSHGITIARRAGLTAEDVLNARSLAELRIWLLARHERASASKAS